MVVGVAIYFPLRGIDTAIRYACISALGFGALLAAGWLLRSALFDRRERATFDLRRAAKLALASGLAAFISWGWIGRPPIPLGLRPPGFEAAGGLRATAGDLARFLAAVMEGEGLDPSLYDAMLSPQVEVNERVAWGLGIGLQTGDSTHAVWHWGVNYPGYGSLMVGFPAQRIGVVVLTNGGPSNLSEGRHGGLELAREVAFRAIGGEHYTYWMGL